MYLAEETLLKILKCVKHLADLISLKRSIQFLFVLWFFTFGGIASQPTSFCHHYRISAPRGLKLICNENEWQLVFHDEFDGEEVDDQKWHLKLGPDGTEPTNRTLWHDCNRERQVYLEDNLSVSNGNLIIEAKREDYVWTGVVGNEIICDNNEVWNLNQQFTEEFKYTSGAINSITNYNPSNIYFEARIKVPKGVALWPAFWLWHHDEVDIFEYFNTFEDDRFRTDYHKAPDHCSMRHDYKNLTDDYHVYGLEITDWYIKWFFDGELIRLASKVWTLLGQPVGTSCGSLPAGVYLRDAIFPDVSERFFGPIINLAINHDNKFSEEDIDRYLPAKMHVDYVRVYKKDVSDEEDICGVSINKNNIVCVDDLEVVQFLSEEQIEEIVVNSVSSNIDILSIQNGELVYSSNMIGVGHIELEVNFLNSYCPKKVILVEILVEDSFISGKLVHGSQANLLNTVNFIGSTDYSISLDGEGPFIWQVYNGLPYFSTSNNGAVLNGRLNLGNSVTFTVSSDGECGQSFRTITIVHSNGGFFSLYPNPAKVGSSLSVQLLIEIPEHTSSDFEISVFNCFSGKLMTTFNRKIRDPNDLISLDFNFLQKDEYLLIIKNRESTIKEEFIFFVTD